MFTYTPKRYRRGANEVQSIDDFPRDMELHIRESSFCFGVSGATPEIAHSSKFQTSLHSPELSLAMDFMAFLHR
jgi:hypothetical protein